MCVHIDLIISIIKSMCVLIDLIISIIRSMCVLHNFSLKLPGAHMKQQLREN